MSASEQISTTLVPESNAANSADSADSARERQIAAIRPHQWKPGESGNPSGRPKGLLGGALWAELKQNGQLEEVVAGILKSCKKGNPKAFAVVRDSVDGRPVQNIDLNATVQLSLADRLEAARKAIKEESE